MRGAPTFAKDLRVLIFGLINTKAKEQAQKGVWPLLRSNAMGPPNPIIMLSRWPIL